MGENATITACNQAVFVPAPWPAGIFDECGSKLPWTVLYLGSSFSQMMRLRREMPSAWTLLPTGDLLNTTFKKLRIDFINLDQAVLGTGTDRSWWDATHLAERNPLSSSLLLNVVRFSVLRDTLSLHSRCLIISDDVRLCELMYLEAICAGVFAGWRSLAGRRSPIAHLCSAVGMAWQVLRGVRSRVKALAVFLRRQRTLRALRRLHPLKLGDLQEVKALFVSWARADSFPADQKTPSDSYLPGLVNFAQEDGSKAGYLMRMVPGLKDYDAVARAALAHEVPVVLLEELVPVRSVVSNAILTMLLPLRLSTVFFAGFDISALLRLESLRELSSADAMFAACHLAAMKSLAKWGLPLRMVVAPYEHQPWEKILQLGLRRFFPNARIVGLQHTPFAHDYLALFPSRREVNAGMVPDLLLLAGKGYTDWFCREGFPANRLVVIGAPRYEQVRAGNYPAGRSVLCCSGIQLEESVELVTKAVLAVRDLDIPLIVNYHPVTGNAFRQSLRDRVSELLDGDPIGVKFVDAPVDALLGEAKVILYSTSAAAFDALFARKYVIYVQREVALDQNKVPENCAVVCRSIEDLRKAITDAFDETTNRFSCQKGGADLDAWLAPTSVSAIQAVFRDCMRMDGIVS